LNERDLAAPTVRVPMANAALSTCSYCSFDRRNVMILDWLADNNPLRAGTRAGFRIANSRIELRGKELSAERQEPTSDFQIKN